MRHLLFSTLSTSRCTPPNKSNEYQKIYSEWCHEFEKYKLALKTWETKKAVSTQCQKEVVTVSQVISGRAFPFRVTSK